MNVVPQVLLWFVVALSLALFLEAYYVGAPGLRRSIRDLPAGESKSLVSNWIVKTSILFSAGLFFAMLAIQPAVTSLQDSGALLLALALAATIAAAAGVTIAVCLTISARYVFGIDTGASATPGCALYPSASLLGLRLLATAVVGFSALTILLAILDASATASLRRAGSVTLLAAILAAVAAQYLDFLKKSSQLTAERIQEAAESAERESGHVRVAWTQAWYMRPLGAGDVFLTDEAGSTILRFTWIAAPDVAARCIGRSLACARRTPVDDPHPSNDSGC